MERKTMGIIENRRSIRKFKGEAIPKEVLMRIVKAGMHAPNAYGKRSWEFLVITQREGILKAAGVNANAAPAKDAAALIIPMYVKSKEAKKSDWWIEDMSACTQNILLKIEEEGLGGVWLGIYPREDRVKYLIENFGIPEGVIPFSLIALGYSDEEGDLTDREDAQIHFERY